MGPDRKHHVAISLVCDEDETHQDLAKCLSWGVSLIKNSNYKVYARKTKDGFEVVFPRLPTKNSFDGYEEIKRISYEELWSDPLVRIVED